MAENSNVDLKELKEVELKCVVEGDRQVGKTSLLVALETKKFSDYHVVGVHETFQYKMQCDDYMVNMQLWDTRETDSDHFNDQIRSFLYHKTNVFLICFSLNYAESFRNVKEKWFPLIKEHNLKAKIILVGTKKDLRENEMVLEHNRKFGLEMISYQKGEDLKNELKAYKYIECSAKTQENVNMVFEEAIRSYLFNENKKSKCSLL